MVGASKRSPSVMGGGVVNQVVLLQGMVAANVHVLGLLVHLSIRSRRSRGVIPLRATVCMYRSCMLATLAVEATCVMAT